MRPEDLTENSVLLGSPAQIAESLKRVESGRLRRGDPVLQRRPEAARTGQRRNGALHGGGGTALPMSMHDRLALYSRNRLKLGLFGANCSSGPSRHQGAGALERELGRLPAPGSPGGRGRHRFHAADRPLEGLWRRHRLPGRDTRDRHLGRRPARRDAAHHRVRHGARAAVPSADRGEAVRHRRPHRPGPLRPQHRLRLERGRVRHVRRHDARP